MRGHYLSQNLLARCLHEPVYNHNPGFRRLIAESGLAFRAPAASQKLDLDAQQELYRQLAERIRDPERAGLGGGVVRLPPYPKYKQSGIEWLRDVPEHWEITRLRHVLARNDGGVWGDEDDPEGTVILRSTEQTLDGGWRIEEPARRVLTELEKRYYVLETGDLVVTKSSGSALHIGKTSLVTKSVATLAACFSNFMQRLRMSSSVDPLLAFYLLNSPYWKAAACIQLEYNYRTRESHRDGTRQRLFRIPRLAERATRHLRIPSPRNREN